MLIILICSNNYNLKKEVAKMKIKYVLLNIENDKYFEEIYQGVLCETPDINNAYQFISIEEIKNFDFYDNITFKIEMLIIT